MAQKLTIKQRKFIKEFVRTGNVSQSALTAGYKHWHSGDENLKKPKIRASIQELMEKCGITDEMLLKVGKEGMEATKVVGYLNNKVNGTQKVSDEFVEIPDHSVRHKFWDTFLKLKKYLTNDVKIDQSQHKHTTIVYQEADANTIRNQRRDTSKVLSP